MSTGQYPKRRGGDGVRVLSVRSPVIDRELSWEEAVYFKFKWNLEAALKTKLPAFDPGYDWSRYVCGWT